LEVPHYYDEEGITLMRNAFFMDASLGAGFHSDAFRLGIRPPNLKIGQNGGKNARNIAAKKLIQVSSAGVSFVAKNTAKVVTVKWMISCFPAEGLV